MYTTTAIQVDITEPKVFSKTLWSIIGKYQSGRLIFLPNEALTSQDFSVQNDDVWESKEWVKAKDILSYIDSLGG